MSLSPQRSFSPRGRRGADLSNSLTSEQIARDLAAFRRGGGTIERLGNTRVLTRVDEAPARRVQPAAPTRSRR